MTGVLARHDIRSRREFATYIQICKCVRSVLLHICGPGMHIILSDGDTLTYYYYLSERFYVIFLLSSDPAISTKRIQKIVRGNFNVEAPPILATSPNHNENTPHAGSPHASYPNSNSVAPHVSTTLTYPPREKYQRARGIVEL